MEPAKDYASFSTNDFITDAFFLQWVLAPDADNDAFWQQWIAAHPQQQRQVAEARAFILRLQFTEQLPTAEATAASLQRNLERIAALEAAAPAPAAPGAAGRSRRMVWRWAAAAVTTGALALGAWQYWNRQAMVRYAAPLNGTLEVPLPDGSLVTLNSGSAVRFKRNWAPAAPRQVWLEGEAFFDVRPLTAAAFTVHGGNMRIEVLGTSFNVKAGAAFTNVSLNTGKIRVRFREMPETPLYLNPGDFIKYSAKDNKIIKKKVNASLYAVWKDEQQRLDNVTLQEMAYYIEDTYGYPVRITDSAIARLRIGGSLRVKDEASLIAALSFTYNVQMKKQNDTLFIQPNTNK